MQFAENFHQSKPEPVQFARAVRLIMKEDESLTAAEVSRIVGAPVDLDAQVAEAAGAAGGHPGARRARRPLLHHGRLRAPPGRARRGHRAEGAGARRGARGRRRSRARSSSSAPATSRRRRRTTRRPPPGWTPRGAKRPSPRRARSATRTGRTPRRARPSRRRRCTTGWATPRSTPSCSARSCIHSATPRTQKLLRITGEADAHEYARSLRPHERLPALRSLRPGSHRRDLVPTLRPHGRMGTRELRERRSGRLDQRRA